jgi:hypothetical protein
MTWRRTSLLGLPKNEVWPLGDDGRVSQEVAGSIWQEMGRGRGRRNGFASTLSPEKIRGSGAPQAN